MLLEATVERRRRHTEALALLESGTPLVLSAQVVHEYLVVATRPTSANGLGMPMPDALANVREFRQSVRLLPEERPILPTFLALLERVPCTGSRVHDAHIVATALAHKVGTIVSLNPGDLASLSPDVVVLSPGEALRERGRVSEKARRYRVASRRARGTR